MAKKFKPAKEIRAIKNKEKRALEERRAWNFKRHILIISQAIMAAIIGICFFIYHANATVSIVNNKEESAYTPSFYEISRDYYESDVYINNLNNSISDILRYVAIREQMETAAVFDENKKIDIVAFANRYNENLAEGPVVEYYLGDLIKWGQKAANNTELYCIYEFYTARDYCDFFSLDLYEYLLSEEFAVTKNQSNDEVENDEDRTVASFETLKNQYQTVENKNIEDYVHNQEDYRYLVDCLIKSANEIYSNYCEYLEYGSLFDEDNTNLRYVVTMTKGGKKALYTNVSRIYKSASDIKIDEIMRDFGEYIYSSPATLDYVTNTPVLYETIKGLVIDRYSYSYPDDTKIWIALDKTYPVSDYYLNNKLCYEKASKLIPWIVSLGAVAFAGFFIMAGIILTKEKKYYSGEEAKEKLSYFDKLPIETGVMAFLLMVLILYLGESAIVKEFDYSQNDAMMLYFVPSLLLVAVDIYIALLFIYALVRRIICKNVFEGSIYSTIAPHLSKYTSRIARWFKRLNDNGNVAIATWSVYVLFLLFNVFWACMLFFGAYPVVSLVVLSIFDVTVGIDLFNRNYERKRILDSIKKISEGEYDLKIDSKKMKGSNKELAAAVNEIGAGLKKAVEISTKDEKLKADLITNVSHDIKTPLTSIINYVDLLKRENIDNERVKKYIAVLDEKSQRLKQLTFDLVEASKITSGNITIEPIKIDFTEFVKQALGEFEEKYAEKGLEPVLNLPTTPVYAMVDPRHMWRVVENVLGNVYKYALENTRVYLDLVTIEEGEKGILVLSVKNISGQQLNIPAEELTERFIRGDVSRSTEGSGLGLSIAKSLTKAQKGVFDIYLDGDLFKVTITMDLAE